jgi:hypothetical protein
MYGYGHAECDALYHGYGVCSFYTNTCEGDRADLLAADGEDVSCGPDPDGQDCMGSVVLALHCRLDETRRGGLSGVSPGQG